MKGEKVPTLQPENAFKTGDYRKTFKGAKEEMNDFEKASMEFIKSLLSGAILKNLELESIRGCLPAIFRHPVRLEPVFQEFNSSQTYISGNDVNFAKPAGTKPVKWHASTILFPLSEEIQWPLTEQALASLSGVSGQLSFEIIGNREGISYHLAAPSPRLVGPLRTVLQKIDPCIELLMDEHDPLERLLHFSCERMVLFELYASPPYYHALYDYKNKTVSPLLSLLRAFSVIPREGIGVYQVLFQATQGPWAKNIKAALDAEAVLRHRGVSQKSFSSELKEFSTKPLFAVRPRIACFSSPPDVVESLKAALGEFQVHGRKVYSKSREDFEKVIGKKGVRGMFFHRSTHMTGMILNSSELSGLVHLPDTSVKRFKVPVGFLDEFGPSALLAGDGIPLGTDSTKSMLVCIPYSSRNFNTYRIGRSTSGKTTSMIHQIAYHVGQGHGVAVFDPHDDLISRLLASKALEPVSDEVCYFNPCDPDYVLDYNPFSLNDVEDVGRLTSDFVNSAKSLFSSWGPRMEHILTMCFYALFISGENLSALPLLLSRSGKGDNLRQKVLEKAGNQEVRRFFEHEVHSYSPDAFLPVTNKLSSILMDDRVSRVFSRKKNMVDVDKILNGGGILLASLPAGLLGAEISAQLGAMLLAQFQKAAFRRTALPASKRRPFFIFVDECYRFNASGIYEGIINECRKFGVFIGLAHQDTGQVSEDMLKTFLSINNLLVFGINIEDAKRLSRVFDNRVKPEYFLGLEAGEALARIGSEIVRVNSFSPDALEASEEAGGRIIEASRRKYYTKVSDVKRVAKDGKMRFYDSF